MYHIVNFSSLHFALLFISENFILSSYLFAVSLLHFALSLPSCCTIFFLTLHYIFFHCTLSLPLVCSVSSFTWQYLDLSSPCTMSSVPLHGLSSRHLVLFSSSFTLSPQLKACLSDHYRCIVVNGGNLCRDWLCKETNAS